MSDPTLTEAQPRYVCPAKLNIAGRDYPCRQMEQMHPDSTNHEGWAHSNPDAEAIWVCT